MRKKKGKRGEKKGKRGVSLIVSLFLFFFFLLLFVCLFVIFFLIFYFKERVVEKIRMYRNALTIFVRGVNFFVYELEKQCCK